jgi:hypothetical protein
MYGTHAATSTVKHSAPSGLHYRLIMIVNDDSWVIGMNDAPSCNVNNDRHSDDSRGVIYAHREHL